MRDFIKNFAIIFIFLVVVVLGLSQIKWSADSKPQNVGVGEIVQDINADKVKKVTVEGSTVRIDFKDDKVKSKIAQKEVGESFGDIIKNYGITSVALSDLQKQNGIEVKTDSSWKFWAINIIPGLIPLVFIGILLFFLMRGIQGNNNRAMGFGQVQMKQMKPDSKDKKTFADVAGAKEAKQELVEIVDFLKNPKKFADMGAKIPKGVLLTGTPGTGKTLLAKAVAGEANVPFFHMSGSEFVEMFVGVGASRVRNLFSEAKKAAPAIVFIDEIDAVGRRRGSGHGGGHDEREQTLNQILVEMDGFEPNSGVIVMAATNRSDVLDPALLRPGRFDRRVVIDMPDIRDREEILGIHVKDKPLAPAVSVRKIAERTPGFSGADLANLLNEAAILTVRRGLKLVGETEVLESIEKVLLGPERKSRIISDHEKKMTAYHESGHAIVGFMLEHSDPVRKVSVISRGSAGGYTLKMPSEDQHYHTLAQFRDDLAMSLGGYVAEKLIFGEDMISTGPSSDLRHATQLARNMITQYGMSTKLGARTFGQNDEMLYLGSQMPEARDYSEKTAEEIDAEVKALLEEAKDRAKEVLVAQREKMEKMVAALMKDETLEQERIEEIMGRKQKLDPLVKEQGKV